MFTTGGSAWRWALFPIQHNYDVTNHVSPIVFELISMEKSRKSEDRVVDLQSIGGAGVVDDIDVSHKFIIAKFVFYFYFYNEEPRRLSHTVFMLYFKPLFHMK